MKVVLAAINAQYIHTALAARGIAAYLRRHGRDAVLCEFNINQRFDDMLEGLVAERAEAYFFSTYIWNAGLVRGLARELHKLVPGAFIAAGGPEAGGLGARFLRDNAAVAAVMSGEGEAACLALCGALEGQGDLDGVPGLLWRRGDGMVENPPAEPLAMDELPFPYDGLCDDAGRIFYYESMRGCPFGCSYCLSGGGGGVRFRSLERTEQELLRFIDARVPQVKFVDRTFNCDAGRALALWRFLAERDNGVTNFHFELAAHLLDEEALELLAGVRSGLFQFEIGVQSTKPDTLRAIGRPGDTATVAERVRRLYDGGNIHLHLDLIAGLPCEGYGDFAQSFNTVYRMGGHAIQLGFLKLLPGSALGEGAKGLGILAQDDAPHEVLATPWITYGELCELKRVAAMVELFHNSGRFGHLLARLAAHFATPFSLFEALASAYRAQGHFAAPPGKLGQYEFIGQFARRRSLADETLQWLCRLDLALHEKPRRVPGWVKVDGSRPYRGRALAFYGEAENVARYLPGQAGLYAKQLLKVAHIEVLPFDPFGNEAGECALLFDYSRRDAAGRALCRRIVLPG